MHGFGTSCSFSFPLLSGMVTAERTFPCSQGVLPPSLSVLPCKSPPYLFTVSSPFQSALYNELPCCSPERTGVPPPTPIPSKNLFSPPITISPESRDPPSQKVAHPLCGPGRQMDVRCLLCDSSFTSRFPPNAPPLLLTGRRVFALPSTGGRSFFAAPHLLFPIWDCPSPRP